MPLTVLIAPDKFKGTLTAAEAAQALARGWRKVRPEDRLILLPMSDGGDGFGDVLSQFLRAKQQSVRTVDAAHRPGRAQWWWESKSKTAIIESAAVIGLTRLPRKRFHPFDLDTFGLGAVMKAAAKRGARRCLIGIGGSATNDGGFGLARALGWSFLDGTGKPIKHWTELGSLDRIVPPRQRRLFAALTVAVDVQNPLLGPRGATRIYGPQKGLRPVDFPTAEKCLRRLSEVARRQLRHDRAKTPGAGAAGGLGFGLMTFLGAQPRAGFDLVARFAGLKHRIRTVDLVITGEGAIDRSTLMGKGVGEIARLCASLKVPCIGLAGAVTHTRQSRRRFAVTRGLTDITTAANAMKRPARWLERLAEQTARVTRGENPAKGESAL